MSKSTDAINRSIEHWEANKKLTAEFAIKDSDVWHGICCPLCSTFHSDSCETCPLSINDDACDADDSTWNLYVREVMWDLEKEANRGIKRYKPDYFELQWQGACDTMLETLNKLLEKQTDDIS